jgi:hypothetical protein
MKTVVIALMVALLVCAGFLVGLLLIPRSGTSSNLPEHLIITNVDYGVGSEGWIAVTVNNTGIASVNIAKLLVNNVKQSLVNPALPVELAPDNGIVINATMEITAGEYQIDALTSKGNMFSKLSSGPTVQARAEAEVMPYKANVNFRTGNIITIDIGNSGTSSGQIVQVYIGTSATTTQSQTTTPPTPISLTAGAITSFNVTYTWSAGETYYFKVVPNSGAALSFTEQAPQ